MAELSSQRFAEFFAALWGDPAFAWQCELARRVIENRDSPWPQAIALPTGAGKTACIDIAVYAVAACLQEADGIVRTDAARRIFFVVDRRLLVDEAYERATELARRLRSATSGILKEVADALRRIAYGRSQGWEPETPLLTFQLRGGMYRSEAWARSPLQPIVVASTVDQIGSRLLFRAYGRGPGMWPVYAGLVANDSVIFLDEAHCARPFMETLQAVARYRRLGEEPVSVPFAHVVLSATPPQELTDVFRDTSAQASDPLHPLGRRQLASKPAVLVPPIKDSGKVREDPLATALAEHALALAQDGRQAVVVFANRIATARSVHALLREQGRDSVLLTGRMRPFDKDDTVRARLSPLSSKGSEGRQLAQPVFVVATQTLEVGADLDFDALVTECASLDALRQRFGRLNRRGRAIQARAAILIRQSQLDVSEEDPVYGAALARTWQWLHEQGGESREVDFGIAQLTPRLPKGSDLDALNAPSVHALVMLPAHLDVLAQTSPCPEPSPDVTWFLHGGRRAAPDVYVCWRADLEVEDGSRDGPVRDLLSYCPPASPECVAVPLWRVRVWLAGEADEDRSSDIEGDAVAREFSAGPAGGRRVVRWRGQDEVAVIGDPSELQPGDVIVVPGNAGDWRVLADLPAGHVEGQPILDWGDRAHRTLRRRALLRLHRNLIAQWPVPEEIRNGAMALLDGVERRLEEEPDAVCAELRDLLQRIAAETMPVSWRWLSEAAASLSTDRALARNLSLHPFGGLIVRGSRLLPVLEEMPDIFSDEHDTSASGTVAVPLAEHLPGVAALARRYAEGTALPRTLAEAVELAARLHDLGKADPRFQALLRGGQRLVGGELLAKSGTMPQGHFAFERARRMAGYPPSGRHELLSVRLAERAEDLLPADDPQRALVLHLIASHHGYCRPFAPVIDDPEPPGLQFELLGRKWSYVGATGLERVDSGVAERFWYLTRRYGWWGLAWLEAMVRLADHRRSEWEQEQASE
ncbi:MAG: type I-U CRISPR-associated helicase/endonuclease Cas3 [Sutterellaceae bacterium]|nr:type I-U CRISPR-associated helicase/endonuclease Cas3 [Burkholderiaceae bacterium]MCX7901238.1 type I-U CRISPR-associated helicase/endonuclease Cas3 [Burkholderiaceae bacterium]MDW8431057.1 type I-U CRISPR-associated helicase/endonuclease Cas3 [Sutterellaceae bacterium]